MHDTSGKAWGIEIRRAKAIGELMAPLSGYKTSAKDHAPNGYRLLVQAPDAKSTEGAMAYAGHCFGYNLYDMVSHAGHYRASSRFAEDGFMVFVRIGAIRGKWRKS